MEIVSKEEAKEKGLSLYFTGKTCRNGGVAPRRVSNSQCTCEFCRKIKAEKDAKYQQQGHVKERHKQVSKEYYLRNKDAHAERVKNWKERNEEYYKNTQKDWLERNREYVLAKKRQYCKDNRHEYARRCKERRARERKATPAWYEQEKEKVKEIYEICQDLKTLTGVDFEVDHIIPVMGKDVCGLHCLANLQPIPADMNRSKYNNRLYDEYLSWLEEYEEVLFTPIEWGGRFGPVSQNDYAPSQGESPRWA